ncbi:DUF4168 domain-containing protein [Bermanella sp. R86510]|uniref:DUF4168 domain-containing protein n=1 Tax=unclassified Bermanella TaxID=2627862 RepID=UPI0037CB5F46
MKTSITQLVLLVSLTFGLASVASAELPPPQGPKVEVSEANLKKFLAVQEDLNTIRNDFSKQVQEAENAQAATKIQQQATEKMMDAVREHDMKVADYNQVATAIQNDPELMEKVRSMQEQ